MSVYCCVSFLFLTAATAAADYKPSEKGKFAVETAADVVLKDEKRKKNLHLKVNYPKEGGKYPVVVFSHGSGPARRRSPPCPSIGPATGTSSSTRSTLTAGG
jgi:predicted dienelactone hydrolase